MSENTNATNPTPTPQGILEDLLTMVGQVRDFLDSVEIDIKILKDEVPK